MALLSTLRAYTRKHHRKVLWALGLSAAGYLAADFVKHKFLQLQHDFFREQAAQEKYLMCQQDATYTVMALLNSLANRIDSLFPVEQLTQELKNLQTAKDDKSKTAECKRVLWSDLKIQTIARFITLNHCIALLVFFTRLQINVLGGRNYAAHIRARSRARDLACVNQLDSASTQVETAYLTFSWWLLNDGCDMVAKSAHNAVTCVFGSVDLRAELSLAELSTLIGRAMLNVDGNLLLSQVLLPPPSKEPMVLSQMPQTSVEPSATLDPCLRQLLNETHEYISLAQTKTLLRQLNGAGMKTAVDHLKPAFQTGKLKLAALLSHVARVSRCMTQGSPFESNVFVDTMSSTPELDLFSSQVFSASIGWP